MKTLLANAGRALLHAYVPVVLTMAVGLMAMPNLDGMKLYGSAALIALFAALGKVIQEYLPLFSFSSYVRQPIAAWLDAITRSGGGALAVLLIGMGGAPDLDTSAAIFAAGIAGVGAAIARALEGLGTPGETPAKQVGFGE